MTQILKDKQAKRLFEQLYKTEVSRATWYRIKALMKVSNMPLTKGNIEAVVVLKRQASQIKKPLTTVLGFYLTALNGVTANNTIKGLTLQSELERITGYKAHRTTIKRWLNQLPNGFNKEQNYRAIDLPLIYLAAFTYKPRSKKCN